MNLHQVLTKHFKGKRYVMRGTQYAFDEAKREGLEWLDDSPKPTEEELRALWKLCQHDDTIELVKTEAQRRIIDLTIPNGDQTYWREKQINMTALFSELVKDALVAGGFDKLPQAQKAQKSALESFWAKVKAIREHSNGLEAALRAGKSVDITKGWP